MKYQSRIKPYKHQVLALAKMMIKKSGALLMDPGTGKSKVAIDFCGRLYCDKRLSRVLVVSPVSALGVWESEIPKHLDGDVPQEVLRLTGTLPQKVEIVRHLNGTLSPPTSILFLLVNYESLWRPDLLKELLAFKPECVIVDESHRIKNHTAQQSKAVCRFNGTKFKLILTGTPITRSPLDVFGQWRFLNPDTFGTRYRRFKNTYGIFGGYMNYEIVGYQNLDDLRLKIGREAFFAEKDECLDLPEATHQNIPIILESSVRRLYEQMDRDFCIEVAGHSVTAPVAVTKRMRLSQITGGFVKDRLGVERQVGAEKLTVLKDLLKTYAYPDRKVVIFARFLWELAHIFKVCKELALNPVVYAGGISQKKRDESLKKFQKDPKCRVFVSQIATGGLGIDLTVAETMIFYSYDEDWGHFKQACDRVHRSGQTKKVLYLHLIVKDSMDEILADSLQNKKELADLIKQHVKEVMKNVDRRRRGRVRQKHTSPKDS